MLLCTIKNNRVLSRPSYIIKVTPSIPADTFPHFTALLLSRKSKGDGKFVKWNENCLARRAKCDGLLTEWKFVFFLVHGIPEILSFNRVNKILNVTSEIYNFVEL